MPRARLLAALAAIAALSAAADYRAGDLEIGDPYALATPPAARAGAGYLTITNAGATPDRLVAVRSDLPHTQIHATEIDAQGVARMREIENLEIPPGATWVYTNDAKNKQGGDLTKWATVQVYGPEAGITFPSQPVLGDVDLDVIRDVSRVDPDLELSHRLVEHATVHSHAGGNAHEQDREADYHLLSGNQLLEVDVQHAAADRVPLDLANQRTRHRAIDRQLNHRVLGGELFEQSLEVALGNRKGLWLTGVAIDDGRQPAIASKRPRGTLASAVAFRR